MRENIILECTECKRRNYTSMKEKRNTPERIEKMKFCKFDRKHTLHRETKQLYFLAYSQKIVRYMQECSSVGRAAVSKTAGREFEPLRSCHFYFTNKGIECEKLD